MVLLLLTLSELTIRDYSEDKPHFPTNRSQTYPHNHGTESSSASCMIAKIIPVDAIYDIYAIYALYMLYLCIMLCMPHMLHMLLVKSHLHFTKLNLTCCSPTLPMLYHNFILSYLVQWLSLSVRPLKTTG